MIFLSALTPKSNLSPRDVLDNAFDIAFAVSSAVAGSAAAVPSSLPSLSVNLLALFVIVTVAVDELLFLSNTVTEYVVLAPAARVPTTSADVVI